MYEKGKTSKKVIHFHVEETEGRNPESLKDSGRKSECSEPVYPGEWTGLERGGRGKALETGDWTVVLMEKESSVMGTLLVEGVSSR